MRAVAVLLETLLARRAPAAVVDDRADGDGVADLVLGHVVTDGRDAADDLVTGDARVDGVAPVVVDEVDVRVADAGVEHIDLHVARTKRSAGDAHRSELALSDRRAESVDRLARARGAGDAAVDVRQGLGSGHDCLVHRDLHLGVDRGVRQNTVGAERPQGAAFG